MSAERRTMSATMEVRSTDDGIVVEGYASTFNQPYDMGIYRETVAPGAFRKTLQEQPDVRFLINHDGLPLARTSSGTLELSEDGNGLRMRAVLDPNDPDVQRIVPKMQRGDLTQMSFAFRTIKDEWNDDYSQRTMKELSLRDGDVSLVTYPANPAATAKLRAAQSAVAMAPLMSRIVDEVRAGNILSQSTFDVLQKIIDAMAAADMELDQALVDLSDLMGIPNPDEDAMPESEGDAVEGDAEDGMEMECEDESVDVDVTIVIARAKAQAAALAAKGHHLISR